MRLAAPGWMMTVTWILTFVLGWFLIAQLGLFAQGFDMLRGSREVKISSENLKRG